MFYSHNQARDKLPKRRRRVLPVEQVPFFYTLNVCKKQFLQIRLQARRHAAVLEPSASQGGLGGGQAIRRRNMPILIG